MDRPGVLSNNWRCFPKDLTFSLGRPLIRQPNLPRLMERGKVEAASCISCNRCLLAMVQQTGVRYRPIPPEG